MDQQWRRRILSVVCIVGFFVVWEALCWLFNVSDIVLPKPSQIIVTLITRMPALWPHTVQTLYTTMVGFAFGILVGIALGVLIGSSRLAYDVAYPLLIGFASIPKVA
ncbi:MAG: ABC transporter permease, partial [Bradyrhizobium sp.]